MKKFSTKQSLPIEINNQIHPRIQIEPIYFKLGFSPVPQIYARQIVLDLLIDALEFLPIHYGFLIWDVYRPRFVQKKLFEWMKEQIKIKYPNLSAEDYYNETSKYMSPPSVVGEEYCPPHLSGGAIDLTLFDLNSGTSLLMGTEFDDCTEKAHSDFFKFKENLTKDEQVFKDRREILQNAMKNVGFTSYHYEWWHYDIGNTFWSREVKKPEVFGPLFEDIDFPFLDTI